MTGDARPGSTRAAPRIAIVLPAYFRRPLAALSSRHADWRRR